MTTAGPDARELARRTAAKIDAIESEMIARPGGVRTDPRAPVARSGVAGAVYVPSGRKPASPVPPPPLAEPPTVLMPATVAAAPAPEQPDLEFVPVRPDTQSFSSAGPGEARELSADAMSNIEVASSSLPPAFEEAAVLYSNGQSDDAEAILNQAILDPSLGAHTRQAWAMLLDLHQACGRREAFEQLAIEYSARFETSPPSWDDTMAPPPAAVASAGVSGPAVVALPAVLDAQAVKQFEQVKRFGQRGRPVAIDVAPVTTVDPIGADLMLRVMSAFVKSKRDMSIIGAESLLMVLASTTETGRRDASEACWMLQLEMLRLLGRQQPFEDLAIDYCVTYEVSPPSWEPLPPTLRAVAPGAVRPEPAPVRVEETVAVGPDAIELSGTLEGRVAEVLAAIRDHAAGRSEVVVQCRRLLRVDFGAAGELLNEIVALKSAGKYLHFRDVNQLVAALLAVMGIPDLADVRLRRL